MADRARGGCLRTGCLGCLVVIGLLTVVGGVIALVALIFQPEHDLQRPELVRELPVDPREPVPDLPGTDTGGETPDVGWPGEAGRVVLDLSMGRFEIVAGKAGEPIRVDGRYDRGTYELLESLEPEGETGWVYRLTFRRSVSWVRELFSQSSGDNRIRLVIPRDTPIVLEGRIGVGESELELGGLWLVRTDLDFGVGDHFVGFEEPTPVPMERFRIGGSVGAIRIFRLGHASPGSVWLASRLGELDVDLRGQWRTDSEIVVRGGIGSLAMRVPDDVSVAVSEASVRLGESDLSALQGQPPAGEGVATLTFEITSGIGEVRIRR